MEKQSTSDVESGVVRTPQRRILYSLFSRAFLQSFTLTFLAEWGDRSQIATIILAARDVRIFFVTMFFYVFFVSHVVTYVTFYLLFSRLINDIFALLRAVLNIILFYTLFLSYIFSSVATDWKFEGRVWKFEGWFGFQFIST